MKTLKCAACGSTNHWLSFTFSREGGPARLRQTFCWTCRCGHPCRVVRRREAPGKPWKTEEAT